MAWYNGMARVFFQVSSWRTVQQQYRRARAMWGDRIMAMFPVYDPETRETRIVVYLRIL